IYSAQWALSTDIVNSTFVSNSAGLEGGAIFQSNKPITVKNSLFHNNSARRGSTRNVNRQLEEGGGNFQSPGSPGDLKVTANTRIANLNLGPLRNNGGDLLTHALLPNSPAINAGVSGAPATDGRGFRRDARPDSGAFEFGGTAAPLPPPAPIPPITGTGAGDNLVGTSGNDVILASFGDDLITGGLGADRMSGEEGADRFLYRGASQQGAFAQSRLNAPDQITDFDASTGDRIQLDYDNNLATANLPRGLFNAGSVRGVNLLNAVKSAYADKTPQNRGRQTLRANEAVLLEWKGGVYLAVNDNQAGYNTSRDLLMNLTGMAAVNQRRDGAITVTDLFI
ncbi:MAG: choice-of-anchor Q domain-containing protein, partial [Elainella sp.]